jgi:predicted enzyme related to lactoylglutathione lyase
MMTKAGEWVQAPTAWALYFSVPDVDAAADTVKASGGQVINGPMDVPGGGRILNGIDPQGAHFALHQKK